jgi:L-threonylcarbamoyladenylate synthase
MRILEIDPRSPDADLLAEAAAVLQRGGLVAFPTETVYGLGANALDPSAVRRIFEAKGRPSFNPLIVHVPDVAAARALTTEWPEAADRLAERYWPGPLTMVLKKQPTVPDLVTAGLPTVAIRVPAHPIAAALLRASGLPIAAPSANRYTSLSPTTAAHVVSGLGDRPDILIDGGPTEVGIESAVVDLTRPAPALLRPGSIPPSELESVLGVFGTPVPAPGEASPRPSPGMTERHYSPRAAVRLVQPETGSSPIARPHDAPEVARAGALVLGPRPDWTANVIRMPSDPLEYARRLYAALHELDARGCETVYIERPPDDSAWSGILDRLRRAAS